MASFSAVRTLIVKYLDLCLGKFPGYKSDISRKELYLPDAKSKF